MTFNHILMFFPTIWFSDMWLISIRWVTY